MPDGEIDAWDRTWIYDPVPDFSYGINLSMAYKGFDFSMFWQGVAGVDVENVAKYQTDFWGVNDVGGNKGARLLDAGRRRIRDRRFPPSRRSTTATKAASLPTSSKTAATSSCATCRSATRCPTS